MKILPTFEEPEDAEDFVRKAFDYCLLGFVIGASAIWIYTLLTVQPPEPEFWINFEKFLGITW